jgi:hypothetical protein
MRKKSSDPVALDRAYDDGKLAGFLGFETSEACPFGSDQPGPRIAWLDGFADGVWKGAFQVNTAGRASKTVRSGWRLVTDRTVGP